VKVPESVSGEARHDQWGVHSTDITNVNHTRQYNITVTWRMLKYNTDIVQ